MHPQKSSRTYIFKNTFVPRENENAGVREKNTFFARPGPIGVRLGRKKKLQTMTSPGESEFRGLNA